MEVWPRGDNELMLIKNTLPKEAIAYVKLNDKGLIDKRIINSENINYSANFESLVKMVNSPRIIEVELNNRYTYCDYAGNIGEATMQYIPYDDNFPEDRDIEFKQVNGLSTGEAGFFGKVLFPDMNGLQNSTNDRIKIIINSNLSPLGAAESFSHEGYGHVLLYITNGGDRKGASHMFKTSNNGPYDSNQTLKDLILNSRRETVKNFNK